MAVHPPTLQDDPDLIRLTSILDRYQNLILLTPIPEGPQAARIAQWQKQAQAELHQPLPYHRMKWLSSIEGARTLLLKLEQHAKNIKVQRTQRECIKDLAQKRMIIKRLRNRVEEIGREVDTANRNGTETWQPGDGAETMYDILQQIRAQKQPTKTTSAVQQPVETPASRDQLFASSTLRHRQGKDDTESTTTGFANPNKTEDQLLAASAQHENITADLLAMAAQLKQQTMAFNFTLDQDKGFVDRAVEGLEQNMSAMGVASKGMRTLQRMSEEQGFWGRLKMQALIVFLWAAAFFLVFAMPKLRF